MARRPQAAHRCTKSWYNHKHAPLIEKRVKRCKEYITGELLHVISLRDHYRRIHDYINYMNQKCRCVSLNRKAKKSYFLKEIRTRARHGKLWNSLNDLVRKDSSYLASGLMEGAKVKHPLVMANIFNDYFSSICRKYLYIQIAMPRMIFI